MCGNPLKVYISIFRQFNKLFKRVCSIFVLDTLALKMVLYGASVVCKHPGVFGVCVLISKFYALSIAIISDVNTEQR